MPTLATGRTTRGKDSSALTSVIICIGPMQAKVSAPTRAGRALRRSLLKGCVVVIVVAGYSGKRFVYERAHELGIRCRLRCQLLRCSCHR